VGLLGMGRFLDRIGVRRGLACSVGLWSMAAMGHALVRTVTGFSVARALLGIGESGNFPAGVKAVAEWFPKRERALATGIFNAGSNVGVVLAVLLVPWITLALGWRWAFVATGALDLLWLAVWLTFYRNPGNHPRGNGPVEPSGKVRWRSLLLHRQTWAFIVGKAMTDPVWLFYLFWLPKFLDANFGVHLAGLAAPLVVIYVAADVGSVTGGWISGALVNRGWSVNRGRKTALFIAALSIVPTMFAPSASSLWVAVGVVSVAAGAHQWWSANLFTTVSDMFPPHAVASVVGLGGFAGMVSAFAFQRFTGALHDHAAVFQYVGAVGDFQRLVGVLLDQEHRHTVLAQHFDDVEDLLDDDRCQAQGGLVQEQ
jgi:ACS family hexuronate transporter-like MFS transporter